MQRGQRSMSISFNIIGCCVCRDIFRLFPHKDFKVDKFIQFVSPVSIIDDTKKEDIIHIDDLKIFDWSNFIKRNLCFDINRNGVERYICKEALSDYLIIDLCELRFKLGKLIFPDGTENIITKTRYFEEFSQRFSSLPQFQNCQLKEIELGEKELKSALDKYIVFILKHYQEKQIILIKNYPAVKHLDEQNREIFRYSSSYIFRIKTKLEQCYNYLESKLPSINVIETPKNALGSVQHLWGKDPLHFVDKYYEYLFKALKLIVYENENQKKDLENLKDYYSDFFDILERQKHIEYYLYKTAPSSLLSNSSLETDENGCVYDWTISLAPDATYEQHTHLLSCGNREKNWAILNHSVNKNEFAGKTLTFSVKYLTYNYSILTIAFVGQCNGKREYITTKQAHSDLNDIESITFTVPEQNEFSSFNPLIYLNSPNHKAIIYETKLEQGCQSSLF